MQLSSTNGVSLMLIAGLSVVNLVGALALLSLEHPPALASFAPDDRSDDTPDTTSDATPGANLVLVRIDEVFRPGDRSHEMLALVNPGPTLDLTGWSIADEDGHRFTFPPFTLFQGGGVNVHTQHGNDSSVRLYWGLDIPVWSVGEQVTLYDADGTVRATRIVQDT